LQSVFEKNRAFGIGFGFAMRWYGSNAGASRRPSDWQAWQTNTGFYRHRTPSPDKFLKTDQSKWLQKQKQ